MAWLLALATVVLAGCAAAPSVRYDALPNGEGDVDGEHAVSVRPTYRGQGTDRPTFTVRYRNRSPAPVEFGPAQVSAFFRGAPVALYRRDDRLAELRGGEVRREIAQVAIGTVAAVAFLWGLSHVDAWGAPYAVGDLTFRWGAEPSAALVAGVGMLAVADAAYEGLGHDADAERHVAEGLLHARRVGPGGAAIGHLVLRDCCAGAPAPGELLRIEVALADGSLRRFDFARVAADAPRPAPPGEGADGADRFGDSGTRAALGPLPPPRPAAASPLDPFAPGAGGQDAHNAERVARARDCRPAATVLVEKGPGYEAYAVRCADRAGSVAVRCELGRCRPQGGGE